MRMLPTKSQSLIEYGLIIGLVALASVLVLVLAGANLKSAYCGIVRGLGGQGTGCSTYLCEDNFSSMANWTGASGWQITNGQLCNRYPPNAMTAGMNTCSLAGAFPSDYEINIDVATLYSGSGYGVFFRTQSTSPIAGYIFQYDPGLAKFVYRKWVNGAELAPFASYTPPGGYAWLNTARKVKIVVQGNTFKTYIDGVLVLTASDATYTRGGVGVRAWDSSNACFDGFNIRAVP
jgi:hypothetical protein